MNMLKLRKIVLSVLFSLFAAMLVSQAALVHPGGWLTETDLERIRSHVASGDEPWKSAWDRLKDSDAGLNTQAHVTADETNNYKIQGDGHAAYILAIKWVASGDIAYAKAAIDLINAWSSTVQTIGSEPMRSGLGANQMANAAEILAYGFHGEAGWAPDDIKRAQTWFKTVVYPHPASGASANWGTSANAGNISMAVFCDDQEMFDKAVAVYKFGFVTNGSLKDGCCGVTQYIDATGEDAESGRDQGHSQGGIAHLVEAALVAWNQGVNLVAYNDDKGVRDYGATGDNRLLLGLEYTAKYNLGNDVPYHPFFEYCNNVTKYPGGISDKGRGNFSPIWEMTYSLFTAAGLQAPYCKQVCNLSTYAPEGSNSDHPGLGTLTFHHGPTDATSGSPAQTPATNAPATTNAPPGNSTN
jgi:hypothetical protein